MQSMKDSFTACVQAAYGCIVVSRITSLQHSKKVQTRAFSATVQKSVCTGSHCASRVGHRHCRRSQGPRLLSSTLQLASGQKSCLAVLSLHVTCSEGQCGPAACRQAASARLQHLLTAKVALVICKKHCSKQANMCMCQQQVAHCTKLGNLNHVGSMAAAWPATDILLLQQCCGGPCRCAHTSESEASLPAGCQHSNLI
jgi:hypothetical protein